MTEIIVITYILIGYAYLWHLTDFEGIKAGYENKVWNNFDLTLVLFFTILIWPLIMFFQWKFGKSIPK